MPSISRLGGVSDAGSSVPVEDQIKAQNPEVKPEDIETTVVNDENDENEPEEEEDTNGEGIGRQDIEDDEGDDDLSRGNSSSASQSKTGSTSGKHLTPQSPVRTTVSHSKTTSTETSAADSTGGSGTGNQSGSKKSGK